MTEEVPRIHVDLSSDFELERTSWWQAPALLVDDRFVSSWPISRRIGCPFPALALLYQYGPDRKVDVGQCEVEKVSLLRYVSWSLCPFLRPQPAKYIFEPDFPWLHDQYRVPPAFCGSHDAFEACQTLAEPDPDRDIAQRPQYRWVLIGYRGTGGRIHTDHAGTSAWNAVVVGRKRWVFFPPSTAASLLEDLPDGHEEEGGAHWYRHKYRTAVARVKREQGLQPLEVVQGPGEVVYVPNGWWHVVRNECFTVALTQNMGNHPQGMRALRDAFRDFDERSAGVWWRWHLDHCGAKEVGAEEALTTHPI